VSKIKISDLVLSFPFYIWLVVFSYTILHILITKRVNVI